MKKGLKCLERVKKTVCGVYMLNLHNLYNTGIGWSYRNGCGFLGEHVEWKEAHAPWPWQERIMEAKHTQQFLFNLRPRILLVWRTGGQRSQEVCGKFRVSSSANYLRGSKEKPMFWRLRRGSLSAKDLITRAPTNRQDTSFTNNAIFTKMDLIACLILPSRLNWMLLTHASVFVFSSPPCFPYNPVNDSTVVLSPGESISGTGSGQSVVVYAIITQGLVQPFIDFISKVKRTNEPEWHLARWLLQAE